MSDFLNPLGGRFIGPSGPVAPSAVTGTVPDPPRAFRQLDPGTIIKGVVLGRESDGLTAIATDKGTVRVASNALLPAGAHVTLEVRPAGDRLQVLILSNDAVQRGAPHNAPAPASSAGAQAAQTPAGQPTTTPPSTSSHPPALPAASAPGPDAHGPDPHAPDTRGTGSSPATAPARGQPPSIQFVGSSLRAVVVHATPPTAVPPTTTPAGQIQPVQIQSGPIALTNAAMLQAALFVADAEKKDRSGQPVSLPNTPTLPGSMPATPDAAHPRLPGQAVTPEIPTPSIATHPVPTGTALSADARLRIVALFASAAATYEGHETPLVATDAQPAAQAPPGKTAAAPPLPLGAELKLRVLAVQMQAHHPIEIDPIADPHAPNAPVIFGRVVAITPAGHAVIHTPLGDIMLQNRSSLPVGAQLALAIDMLEPAPPPAALTPPMVQTPQQALLSLAQGWPTLADLIAVFQGAGSVAARPGAIDPDIARQALGLLPHAGNKLGAGLMNAMAALRSGDIGKLLGPLFAAKGAGAEREEMVRRLRGEFAQLSALAQDRPEVDWRALFLPILDDQGRVTQINLFYRRPKKGETEDKAGGGAGTRFVVEADFSRLGPFQLDGLMRKQRFDLMIRSRQRLSDRMRRDVEAIYEEARGLTGFTGAIAFQTVAEFPVVPLDDLKRASPTVMV